jgi:cytochrome c
LEPNNNLTGPSLSSLFGRKAGTLESFNRYSDALKSAGIVWNDKTLDAWLANPKAVVPGNTMTYSGIANPQQRGDLLAFLQQATKRGAATAQAPHGGMGGMMMGGQVPNLKSSTMRIAFNPSATARILTRLPRRTEKSARSGNAICGSKRTPARTDPQKGHPR